MIKIYTYFTKSKNTDTKASNTFVVLGLRNHPNYSFEFDKIVSITIYQKVHQFIKKANVAKNRGQMIQNGVKEFFFCPVSDSLDRTSFPSF